MKKPADLSALTAAHEFFVVAARSFDAARSMDDETVLAALSAVRAATGVDLSWQFGISADTDQALTSKIHAWHESCGKRLVCAEDVWREVLGRDANDLTHYEKSRIATSFRAIGLVPTRGRRNGRHIRHWRRPR